MNRIKILLGVVLMLTGSSVCFAQTDTTKQQPKPPQTPPAQQSTTQPPAAPAQSPIVLPQVVQPPASITTPATQQSGQQYSVLPKVDATTKAEFVQNKVDFEQGTSTTKQLLNQSLAIIQNTTPAQVSTSQAVVPQVVDNVAQQQAALTATLATTATTIGILPESITTVTPESSVSSSSIVANSATEYDRRKKDKRYGATNIDSRIELRQLDPLINWQLQALTNARSVGLIIKKTSIKQITDSLYQISTGITFKQKYNLCPSEPFGSQPVAGDGSAFLVNDQEIITASHVVAGLLDNYALVFGFEILNKKGAYIPIINAKDIYYLSSYTYQDGDVDLVRIKLNRKTERPFLKLAQNRALSIGTEVYMLGYPAGLPLKAAINASIATEEKANCFYTSLDAFQGNSGSPVIDLKTNEVIGILVAGTADFAWNGTCNISTKCVIPFCKGEKVFKIPQLVINMKSDPAGH